MPRVLVLEDEVVLRSSMVRGLSKLPNIAVDGAGTLDEALAAIDTAAPDLILSDLDLPHRSGIELVGELASRRLQIPIVYISAYLNAYGAQIPPNACVEVLEKPVELRELRELVLRYVGTDESASAAATPFSLVDYVQLAALGCHSVQIRSLDSAGREGTVILHAGQVWHAEDEDGAGRDALFRLLTVKSVKLDCRTQSEPPGVRNVEGRWDELLIEAARLADEAGVPLGGNEYESVPTPTRAGAVLLAFDEIGDAHGGDGWPPSAAESAAEPSPEDDPFTEARERGLEALLAKDYESAYVAFSDADRLRPGDRVVAANLSRLRDLGVPRDGGASE